MNQAKIRKIIKEEMQRYLKEFDIPQSPTDKGREMGQDPTGDETSTLGLEEAETSDASVIGLEIAESWEAHSKEAWQSLFKALDERSDGVNIAKQLQKISDDYLKSYTKQEDEDYARSKKAREERATARGPARRPSW
tara:strand:+ start:156 stop:566 length:411 start_codon:yes stop_codon:yes gene_type:complete